MTTYDKHGTWVTRPDPKDTYASQINLNADPDHLVPLTVGMCVDSMIVRETRNYTIREIRTRIRKADQRRNA